MEGVPVKARPLAVPSLVSLSLRSIEGCRGGDEVRRGRRTGRRKLRQQARHALGGSEPLASSGSVHPRSCHAFHHFNPYSMSLSPSLSLLVCITCLIELPSLEFSSRFTAGNIYATQTISCVYDLFIYVNIGILVVIERNIVAGLYKFFLKL